MRWQMPKLRNKNAKPGLILLSAFTLASCVSVPPEPKHLSLPTCNANFDTKTMDCNLKDGTDLPPVTRPKADNYLCFSPDTVPDLLR